MGMWASVEIPRKSRTSRPKWRNSPRDENEMGKKPIDRTKIDELYKKRVELRNEFFGWRFQQRLDMIEKLQK